MMAFTFDDGSQCQVDLALPVLEEFGFKATFFVVAGLTRERKTDAPLPGRAQRWWGEVSWEEWRAIAARGHEIGNHSLTHSVGGVARAADPQAEIVESARIITEKMGRAPESFAFPFGKFTRRVRALAAQQHRFVRRRRARYGGWFFNLALANWRVDRALQTGRPLIAMLHGIESGFQPVDRALLRAHCAYIKERGLVVDTFANVSRISVAGP